MSSIHHIVSKVDQKFIFFNFDHPKSITSIDKRMSSIHQIQSSSISTTLIKSPTKKVTTMPSIKSKMQKKARSTAITATVLKVMVKDHLRSDEQHRKIEFAVT